MVRLLRRWRARSSKLRSSGLRFGPRLIALEAREVPATFQVNMLGDANVGSGLFGDLRYCIGAAGAGDVITFDPALFATPQTISVSAPLVISSSLTITGPGFDGSGNPLVTVKNVAAPSANSRVFVVNPTPSVSIAGITITGGAVTGGGLGGGLSVSGAKLTLDNTVITGNTAGGGGGLYTTGDLVVRNSTISGNTANAFFFGYGGGLSFGSSSYLRLEGSTVSGNSAAGGGGGIAFGYSGRFSIANSTISGNSAAVAGGGLAFIGLTSGTSTIQNSTITGNAASVGGGAYFYFFSLSFAAVSMTSSIVAANTGLDPDLSFNLPIVLNGGNNLVGVGDAGNFTLSGSNIQGTLVTPENPNLGPLTNNGGLTKTHAVLPGSKAIDAGSNPLGLTFDQRGFGNPRFQGLKVDVGAFESSSVLPAAAFLPVPAITVPGATPNTVQVIFFDTNAIDAGSIAPANIEIVAPDNSKLTVTGVSVSPAGNGSPRTATYTFTPPGGAWDGPDYGAYTVNLLANQVADTDVPTPNFAVAQTLGTFSVTIGRTLLVDDPSDIDDGNVGTGQLSLREAVRLSNEFAGALDTITFDPGVTSITLTNGQFSLTDAVSIVGPGAGSLTINADQKSRHFSIDVPGTSGNAVSLSGMTLTQGKVEFASGGSIENIDEALTLTGMVLQGNLAENGDGGAVYVLLQTASLSVAGSSFIGNQASFGAGGGAITIVGASKVSIDSSTLSGNTSDFGGGAIYGFNNADLTITNSTLSGNSAAVNGGAVLTFGGTLTIRNSTISGNVAQDGAGIRTRVAADVTITNSTVAFNRGQRSGGISISGSTPVMLSSTIVAGNSARFAPDFAGLPGSTIAGGNNLIGQVEPGVYDFAGVNLLGTPASPVDPRLGPLAANGGPTLTHGLAAGSPAIDAGAANGLTTDQRGGSFVRVLGAAADVGAFEGAVTVPLAFLAPPAKVTTATASANANTVVVTYFDDVAIDASTFGIDDIVITGPGMTNVAVTGFSVDTPGNGSPRTVTYTFAIPGGSWDTADNGAYVITQPMGAVTDTSANGVAATELGTLEVAVGSVFVVDEATDIDDMDTSKGKLSLREAIQLANSQNPDVADLITFDPVVFAGATTINLTTGTLLISDTVEIQGPGAAKLTINGQAMRIFDIDLVGSPAAVIFSGLTLTNGKASDSNGGAIRNGDAWLTLANSVLTGNEVSSGLGQPVGGGAIGLIEQVAELTLLDSVVTANAAIGSSARGGGIHVESDSVVRIERSTISGNQSGEDGAGVYFVYGGDISVIDSTISGNNSNLAAGGSGGAGFYFFATRAVIRNSTVSGNRTDFGAFASPAGGISARFNSAVVVQNGTVAFNRSTDGGGVVVVDSDVRFDGTIVAQNLATNNPDVSGEVVAVSSLIGSSVGLNLLGGSVNNLLDVDPMLDGLANNGGSTLTHALKTGSPALNAGSNAGGSAFDQRGTGFARVVGGTADIGAFEVQAVAPPPSKVSGNVIINNGAAQRSRVTSLKVNFDNPISFNDISKAFILTRDTGGNPSVGLNTVLDGSGLFVTITFTGGEVDAPPGNQTVRSLVDGKYTFTIVASEVANGFDGGMGVGTNFVLGSTSYVGGVTPTPATGIFRNFGDATGDGFVGADDFLAFRLAFLTANDTFDYDGANNVDATVDFLQFRLNFLTSV